MKSSTFRHLHKINALMGKNRRRGEVGGGTLYLNVEYVGPHVPTDGM